MSAENNTVWPSRGDLATYSAPINPLAPGLFSITTGCSANVSSRAPTARQRIGPAPGWERDHDAKGPAAALAQRGRDRDRSRERECRREPGQPVDRGAHGWGHDGSSTPNYRFSMSAMFS